SQTTQDLPGSFESLLRACPRVAVADAQRSALGETTAKLLKRLNVGEDLKYRVMVVADARSVIDHLTQEMAECGVLFGPDASQQYSSLVRIAALAPQGLVPPIRHSMAMQSFSPDRLLSEQFLSFIQTKEAQKTLVGLGYQSPPGHTVQ